MLFQILLLLILVPLADLLILMMISHFAGFWVACASVAFSGIVGAWLARRQWRRIRVRTGQRLERNELPTEMASEALVVVTAAGLLMLPGVLTDIIGVTLLLPVCRGWYKRRILKWLQSHFKIQILGGGNQPPDPNVVDGEYRTADRSRSEELPRLPE